MNPWEQYQEQGADNAPWMQYQESQKPKEPTGVIDTVKDMFTGASKQTQEIKSLSEIGNAPELNEMSWSAFKTSLGLLATGDEEKAKSVIKSNIPDATFTTDSSGNTIVNLPSGQYALNAPGLSGQDIVKGVFDVAAFTPAGRAATIGRAAAGSGATEAALQAATSAVGGGEIEGEEIAESALLGGAFKAAEDVIGAGYRAMKGRPQGESAELVQFAEKQNLPLMTTDVVEPKTFVGKSAQSAAEKVPFAGTGAMRETQQEARRTLVSDFAKRFGEYNPEEVVESLQRQTSRIKAGAGRARQSIMDEMQGASVMPSNALKAIDDEIARLSKSPSGVQRETADTATIEKLQAYRNDLEAEPTFQNLEQLRSQFRTDVKGERSVINDRSSAAINKIYAAMTKDMDDSISSSLGEAQAKKWKRANSVYASEMEKLKSTRLKSVLQKGDLTPEVVNNLIYSTKPSEFRNLYRSLDNKGKSAARSAIIGKAFDKSGGSPEKFYSEMNKMKSQLGIAFKNEDKRFIDGMLGYIDATRQASKAELLTPTGQQLYQVAVPGAIATDIGLTGGLNIAGALGYGGLARAYESKPVRAAIMRLNSMEKGSSQFEQQLKKVSTMLSAISQSSRRED